MTRYQVIEDNQHGCCMDATVIDTAKPEMINGQPWVYNGVPQYEGVCECWSREDAEMVAKALNALEKTP